MKKITIILSLIILPNCKGQDSKLSERISENLKAQKNMLTVENILKDQLESGSSGLYEETADGETYNYKNKDLEVTIPILKEKLEISGFRFLNNEDFNSRIKVLFGRIINSNSDSKYLYLSPIDKCERVINFYRNKNTASANLPSYYIIKNINFITDLYALPEFINYQKEYPNLAKIEDSIKIHIVKDGNNVKLNLWKNEKDLEKRRFINQQLLISRNKYLFNDDKSQFPWLVMHDEFFMRNLVTEFGYTEDKKLLKWVIENTDLPLFSKFAETKHLKELGKLLWTKDCNGEIRVHQNTLDLLKELSTPHDDLYIMYVAEYLSNYMASFAIKEENLTIEQKAKIAAYLLYWGEQYKYDKHYDYNQMFMTRFYYYHFEREAYEKEFKKNNYYGLPKFKEWYEAAKKEKDYFNGGEGMEDDPNPYDYRRIAEPIK
ncbi:MULTISPECIES: hypothetical protein [unclassified Apibacter]|uniref:hypothetical protein n=1 Tax=unclassified Apibacter TaxID=2630820 RepID=UPI001325E1A8|nr:MULTISPECIES: hypothetical protein [unclassified Apibacter]MXO24356.1 hypothetical protein [Apibacter sp. B3924]MXO27546.1 hypothetical protein [Apibacter sp. B3813]MXO29501.1 hypothetical protein [Apibacter sp. B3913]MXO31453.1 hypothetical protein [Apibacter sp. B3912]MXP02890.1 hypothetical protein [Apibacter sp. B3918]